jgi:hypothetical protein
MLLRDIKDFRGANILIYLKFVRKAAEPPIKTNIRYLNNTIFVYKIGQICIGTSFLRRIRVLKLIGYRI